MIKPLTLAALALGAGFAFGEPAAADESVQIVSLSSGGTSSFNFSLPRKSGRELYVETAGDSVVIYVSAGSQANLYIKSGTVTEDGGIRARFGHFGRIAVEFTPRGKAKPEEPFPGCHGKPIVRQPGVFVGRVRFNGERGFAKFAAAHSRGEMVTAPAWKCRGGSGGDPDREPAEEAVLQATTPHGSLAFYAAGHRRAAIPGSVFFASENRTIGGVREIRDAIGLAHSPKTFEFDDALSTATVHPGWPFHGTGTFQRREAGAAAWTGDLRVSFLGGDVALTGGRLEASLSHPRYPSRSRWAALDTLGRSPRPTDR